MKALVVLALLGAVVGPMGRATAQGVCPPSILPFTGRLKQMNEGTATVYDWTISPTMPTSATPRGDGPCSGGGGYVQQFVPGGGCVDAFPDPMNTSTPTANGCTYTFVDSAYNQAVVVLTCGNTSTLAMSPTVTLVGTPYAYIYTFTGSIDSVCPGAPPAPSPPSTNFALTQLVCSDSLCSQGCSVYRPPQGQCEPVPAGAGESAKVTCTSASAVSSELFPQSTTCSGPAVTTTTPTGVCIPREDGTFVTSYCSPAQMMSGLFLRRPKQRHS